MFLPLCGCRLHRKFAYFHLACVSGESATSTNRKNINIYEHIIHCIWYNFCADTFFHRALLSYLIGDNKKINYNVHCFCSTYARFLLKNEARKILIRYEIHKVVYFYFCPPVFFSCFLAWTAISRVYSGMQHHTTSRQQNITVHILVTGAGRDAQK